MSDLHQIYLNRPDSSYQWGFRLEGGSDLQQPLRIQKVSANSISDRSGLQVDDTVIRINNQDALYLTHEQAKMEIIRSGNDVTLLVQRGGQTIWKPRVTPMHEVTATRSSHHPTASAAAGNNQYHPPPAHAAAPTESGLVTRTSLAANRSINPSSSYIGSSHNAVPQPFQAAVEGGLVTNTADGKTKKIVHSQYNSPMGLYSQQNAESTFQQSYQQVNPAAPPSSAGGLGGGSGFRHIQAPVTDPNRSVAAPPATSSMFCGSCGDLIKGVFVKVQGRIPMHPACLKCVKCGVGLRNVGYFYLDNQLYCETHAKQVSRPPGPGLQAVPMYK